MSKHLILGTAPSKHKHKQRFLKTVMRQPRKFETALWNSSRKTDRTRILIGNLYNITHSNNRNTRITWIGLFLRLRRSHTLTFPSMEPESMTVDSSLKHTQFTLAAWPRNLRSDSPVVTFHIMTDLSRPHDPISLETSGNGDNILNLEVHFCI